MVREYTQADMGELTFYSNAAGGGYQYGVEGIRNKPWSDTRYIYDSVGQLRAMQVQPQAATIYFYDDQGNRTGELLGDGSLTEWRYDASGRLLETVRYSGRLDYAQLVASGDLTVSAGVSVATVTHNDWLSAVSDGFTLSVAVAAMVNDTGGDYNANEDRHAYYAYDDAGRLRYVAEQVFGGGPKHDDTAVTETRYNAAGEVIAEIRYATAYADIVSVPSLSDFDAFAASSADPMLDRETTYAYDAQGRLARMRDAEGYVTEYAYNALDQVIRESRYATALGAIDSVPQAHADDQHVYTLYNAIGQQVGQIDGEGYLQAWTYRNGLGGDGLLERVTRYEHRLVASSYAVDDTALAVLTLDDLLITGDADDTGSLSLDQVLAGDQQYELYGYNDLNERIWSLDQSGVFTEWAYDIYGRLVSTARGREDSDNNEVLDATDDASQRRVLSEQTHDELGRVNRVYDGLALASSLDLGTSYAYGESGLLLSMTERWSEGGVVQSSTTVYYYDDAGRERFSVNALGHVRETVYNAFGEVTDTLDYATPLAALEDASGEVLVGGVLDAALAAHLSAVAGHANDRHERIEYQKSGLVNRMSDAANTPVWNQRWAYDALGNTSQQFTYGEIYQSRESYEYDRRGLGISSARGISHDVDDHVPYRGAAYDAFGRVTRREDAHGHATVYSYDKTGRVLSVTDPLLHSSHTTWDGYGRVLTRTDQSGVVTTYQYDDVARTMTESLTLGEGHTITTITAFNHHEEVTRVEVMQADGSGLLQVTEYDYDANGNVVATRALDRDGSTVLWEEDATYDARNLLIQQTDARGVETHYQYDAISRQTRVTADAADGGLQLGTSTTYDHSSRTMTQIDAGGIETVTHYDHNGRVKQVVVDPNGEALLREYDYTRDGQLKAEHYGSVGNVLSTITYSYVEYGRLRSISGDGQHAYYTYDENDNLIKRTDGRGHATHYVYDARNELRYTIDPLGYVTETRYDDNGRVSDTLRYRDAVLSEHGLNTSLVEVEAWLSGNAVSSHTAYDYDAAGRLVMTTEDPGGLNQSVVNRYDANGNVIARVDAGGYVTRHVFDAVGS